jgi:Fic family protein
MQINAKESKLLTSESILQLHGLTMKHRSEIAGKFRTHSVHIKGNPDYVVADFRDVGKLIGLLLQKYNAFSIQRNSLNSILDFAAYFHNEFQHIHPFTDGNSRTTRLIMFHLLKTQGIPVFDIPLGLIEEYIASTKGSKARDDSKLKHVLQQIVLFNLRAINSKLSQ